MVSLVKPAVVIVFVAWLSVLVLCLLVDSRTYIYVITTLLVAFATLLGAADSWILPYQGTWDASYRSQYGVFVMTEAGEEDEDVNGFVRFSAGDDDQGTWVLGVQGTVLLRPGRHLLVDLPPTSQRDFEGWFESLERPSEPMGCAPNSASSSELTVSQEVVLDRMHFTIIPTRSDRQCYVRLSLAFRAPMDAGSGGVGKTRIIFQYASNTDGVVNYASMGSWGLTDPTSDGFVYSRRGIIWKKQAKERELLASYTAQNWLSSALNVFYAIGTASLSILTALLFERRRQWRAAFGEISGAARVLIMQCRRLGVIRRLRRPQGWRRAG